MYYEIRRGWFTRRWHVYEAWQPEEFVWRATFRFEWDAKIFVNSCGGKA
jgi:hypothetical protein